MFYIGLSFVTGCVLIVAMSLNAQLGNKVGIFQSTLYNYVMGLATIGILFSILIQFDLLVLKMKGAPFYAYLGGACASVIVIITNIILPKLSVFYAMLLILVGQIFFGIVIDYYIYGFYSKGKILGGILILGGMLYNTLIDKKETETETETGKMMKG